jgi:hypothetical protein
MMKATSTVPNVSNVSSTSNVRSPSSKPFAPVLEVASILGDLHVPWFVAGGWTIDLCLQRQQRTHKDVDILVLRHEQLVVQDYLLQRGWTLSKYVGNSMALERMEERRFLKFPDRGILAKPPDGQSAALDIFLADTNHEREWCYHADPRITHSLASLGCRSSLGVPALSPEIALRYKARHIDAHDTDSLKHQAHDESDFKAMLGCLTREQKNWLRGALRVLYANHPWLIELAEP